MFSGHPPSYAHDILFDLYLIRDHLWLDRGSFWCLYSPGWRPDVMPYSRLLQLNTRPFNSEELCIAVKRLSKVWIKGME